MAVILVLSNTMRPDLPFVGKIEVKPQPPPATASGGTWAAGRGVRPPRGRPASTAGHPSTQTNAALAPQVYFALFRCVKAEVFREN